MLAVTGLADSFDVEPVRAAAGSGGALVASVMVGTAGPAFRVF